MANIELDGANKKIKVDSGDLTLDVPGDIVLDADGANITFKDGGTSILDISNSSSDAVITSSVQDKDIIFKGDDNGSAITALTLDMSEAGAATFNSAITGGGLLTTGGNIVIPNAGNIGSASDTDAMAIASNGVVTFSQNPVFPDGGVAVADLDIDGATDIGADIVDADLFIIDDGAGGTNRKTAASRLKTYIGDSILTQVATVNETSFTGTLTFASCFTSTYRNYFVVFDNCAVATDGADVNMLFHYGDSNGNDSTNHNHQNLMRYPGTTDAAGGQNENDIKFIQAQNNGAGNFFHGTMYVFQPLNTTDGVTSGTIYSQSNSNNSAGAQITMTAFNMPEAGTNSAYTGFQFAASTGNIKGRITVYGIKNPA